jgi:hypothetical protein
MECLFGATLKQIFRQNGTRLGHVIKKRRGPHDEDAWRLELRKDRRKTTTNNNMDLSALFPTMYDTVYLKTTHWPHMVQERYRSLCIKGDDA